MIKKFRLCLLVSIFSLSSSLPLCAMDEDDRLLYERTTSLPREEVDRIKQHIDRKIDGVDIDDHLSYVEKVSKKYGENGINFAVYAAKFLPDDVGADDIDDISDYIERLEDIHPTMFNIIIKEMKISARGSMQQYNYNIKQ